MISFTQLYFAERDRESIYVCDNEKCASTILAEDNLSIGAFCPECGEPMVAHQRDEEMK